MKKQLICTMIGAAMACCAYTQEVLPVKTFVQEQDSLFQHLDPAKRTTGILYDRVYPWAALDVYTQQNERAAIDYEYVQQAWQELYEAAYEQEALSPLSAMQQKIDQNTLDGKGISIGYINCAFEAIDSNAVHNGALSLGPDSLLYEGNNSFPVYTKYKLVLPLIAAKAVKGHTVFYADPAIVLSNDARTLMDIQLSIPGQTIRLKAGESGSLDFSGISTERIVLSVTLSFSDGSTVITPVRLGNTHMLIQNSVTTNVCTSSDTLTIWSNDLKFQGYEEIISSQGKGKYKIFYHQKDSNWNNCDKNIRKPIIIIDGFDPGDSRKITKDPQTGEEGIWDLLSYGNKHLGDELRYKGYDVIVLNFPKYNTVETGMLRDGGADYIERNAMVLIRLIQQVNTELQQNGSTEKIVIVGPSMGGLIARYALKYMEQQQALGIAAMNHNTRLYVSFDSPHKGANIPLGLQYMIWYDGYIRNNVASKVKFDHQIRSVAARQMLIHQTTQLSPQMAADATRSTWQATLDSIGFPVNLRKVALLNGTGNAQESGGCTIMIDYEAIGTSGLFTNALLVHNRIKTIATDNGGNCELFYFKQKPHSPFSVSYNTNNTYGSLDKVQGGQYDVARLIKNELPIGNFYTGQKFLGKIYAMGRLNTYAGDYNCFIPSVSALAFHQTNMNWGTGFSNRNLVCTQEIPFDNYYTPAVNEPHVTLTSASAKWITEEIEKGQQGCAALCMSATPASNNVNTPLCINSIRTIYHNYTLSPGATVSWDIDTTILQKISSGNHSVTVKAIGSSTATPVCFTIHNPCGANVSSTLNLVTGVPEVGEIAYAINSNTNMVKAEPFMPQQASYSWSWNGTTFNNMNVNPYPSTFPQMSVSNSIQKLWLKVENICGAYTQFVFPTLPAAPLMARTSVEHAVYPNPSRGDWTVDIPGAQPATMTLHDLAGRLVWNASGLLFRTEIPGARLSPGVYLLKITAGKQQYRYKLVRE